MSDFKRDRGDGERYQEALDAYLDNTLTPADRARFEARLAADPRLRTEMEQLRALRLQMRAMPRRRVPRSFALDPAVYARPKAQPLLQLYPLLRGATALSAFLLIVVLALGAFTGQFGPGLPAAGQVAQTTAEEPAVAAVEREEAASQESAPETAAIAAAEVAGTPTEAADAAALALPAEVTPLPAATAAPVPSGDLTMGAPPPEETLPADAGGGVEPTPAPEFTGPAATIDAFAQDTANEAATAPAPQAPASLLWWQIGLGGLFLVLLVLWLLARRRVRSL